MKMAVCLFMKRCLNWQKDFMKRTGKKKFQIQRQIGSREETRMRKQKII